MFVYRLTHEYYNCFKDCDIVTDIAVYSTKAKATEALKRFKRHPFFKQKPGEFCISKWEIDHASWTEGFDSFDEA